MKTVFGGYEVKDGPPADAPACDTPAKAMPYLEEYRRKDREHFLALYLNARNQVIAMEVVSVGTLSASLVHPREIFKGAILNNAAAIIVAHNHPSGNVAPSPEDLATTTRIKRAGELMGIPLLDHIIIGSAGHTSLREMGLL